MSLLLLVNVAVGLRFSPIVALRHVRVVGAEADDEAAIKNLFGALADTGVLDIRVDALETALQQLPDVDSAAFNANIFGSGKLVLTYRVPVARLDRPGLALDSRGEIWKTRKSLADLPLVRLPASCLMAGLSLARAPPVQVVAELAVKLPGVPLRPLGAIILDASGTVCLNRGNQGRIVFGGTEAMDEKSTRLAALLHDRAELFSGPFEVNLTAPSHPVYSPIPPKAGGRLPGGRVSPPAIRTRHVHKAGGGTRSP